MAFLILRREQPCSSDTTLDHIVNIMNNRQALGWSRRTQALKKTHVF